MSRRADPARIQVARRAATAGRLRDTGMLAETVATWLDAWERTDGDRSAADYWQRGHEWIQCQVAAGRRTPIGRD